MSLIPLKDMVPDYFVRKQTLTNAERFTTDELKQLEDVIMGAEEKLVSLEYDLHWSVSVFLQNNQEPCL